MGGYRCLASAFAHLGRDAEAREAVARLLQLDPASTISAMIARGGLSNAKLLIEGLRKAGCPNEARVCSRQRLVGQDDNLRCMSPLLMSLLGRQAYSFAEETLPGAWLSSRSTLAAASWSFAGRAFSNNAAERALRGFALGRKSWLFAGSDRGADRAAIMATLIMTAKLNDIDPQAWLADVLARIATLPQGRLCELLPWNWSAHVRSVAPPQAA